MNLETMIELLNGDLAREYAHWHFYTNAAFRIQGSHREEYSEFLSKKADEEKMHIEQWTRLIIGRGGVPCVVPAEFKSDIRIPQFILEEALRMELEVVDNFVERQDQAVAMQEFAKANVYKDLLRHGRYIELFLDDQILDSQGDADHLKEILLNW